jgi:glycosyltransferase involved in cell wall biosynthesis
MERLCPKHGVHSVNAGAIAIVIAVHNRIAHTVQCLQSIRRSTFKKFAVYVVDDGSTDGTQAVLAERYPEVKVLQGDGNLWWTRAVNAGVRRALRDGARYILLLNNDNLLSQHTLEELLRVSQLHNDAVTGSVVVYQDKGERRIKHASLHNCVDRGIKARNPFYDRLVQEVPETLPTEILSGQGSLIPRWVFERVGLFDAARFPHYMGDFDFFMRCGRRNIPMFVAGKAIVKDDVTATGVHMAPHKILSVRDFVESLFATRSHRNVRTNVAYFRRYCKSSVTCLLGLTIFYSGYLISFLLARLGLTRIRESLIRKFV